MSKISLLSALVSISLLFNACTKKEEKNSTKEANSMLSTTKTLSPNKFVLTGLDNKHYTVTKESTGFQVDGAKNKVIIFDIFATWCPPCQAEASHLASLQKKYKDSLLIIGISVENGIENSKLQDFRSQHAANYVLVNSNENASLIDAVATELKIGKNFGIPLMALYKDGKFVNMYQGATEEEFIESDIKKALGK